MKIFKSKLEEEFYALNEESLNAILGDDVLLGHYEAATSQATTGLQPTGNG